MLQLFSPAVMTGADVIRAYLDDLKLRESLGRVTPEHAGNHRRSLANFLAIIGDRTAAQLVQHDLTRWLAANPSWRSPETRRNNLAAVLACFNWADEEGILRPTPYRKTRRLKEPRKTRRDATDAEAATVWEFASPALRRVILLIDATGMRTCEVRGLRWDQIDLARRVIRLDRHKTRRHTGKPRIIGFDQKLADIIASWRREGELVCLSEEGRPWTKNNLDQCFARLRRRLCLPDDLKLYGFRHRFSTQCRRGGTSMDDVAELMGHTDARMTRAYTHVSGDAERIAEIAHRAAGMRKRPRQLDRETPLFDGLE